MEVSTQQSKLNKWGQVEYLYTLCMVKILNAKLT